jgi:predicted acylesterase/phospholipase RssA
MALLHWNSVLARKDQVATLRDLILCTYKDTGLPAETRLGSADRMLRAIFGKPLAERPSQIELLAALLSVALEADVPIKQDFLGIAGAVEKRRWEFFGLRKHLVCASHYYSEGHAMGCEQDEGYNGINLAFVLDLLSEQEEGELDGGKTARDRATEVRKEIIRTLDAETSEAASGTGGVPNRSWWLLVTLGEAYLGIGEIPKAVERMAEAAALKKFLDAGADELKRIAPWQLETVARQVVRVAQIQTKRAAKEKAGQTRKVGRDREQIEGDRKRIEKEDVVEAPFWKAVEALLDADSKAAQTFLYGKIGLALSGGGFRASLFHIGVLARLAELDVLRHVEVLSCVSGGSILGAHYYLELRNLLQTKTDGEIRRQDYIDLVERLRKDFLAGVQGNIRLQMLFGWHSKVKDGEDGKPRYLADLRVAPRVDRTDASEVRNNGFNPKYDNWSRRNKIPALILNATSLNTCHNWQFTASFMGEPPARSIDIEIDANHRLRRMYHSEAPPVYRRPAAAEAGMTETGIRLGEAVAASACVPGLFDPLHLEGMYGTIGQESEDYITALVDGGNYDNQGIASLREQDCSVLIISDACGQTAVSIEPKEDHFGVMMRANDILMSRTREVQYQLLSVLEDSGAISGLMYLHLKKGLEAQTVDWVDCDDPSPYDKPPKMTEYGVRQDVQRLIAGIRTDLDSFSWLESDALMLCGYRMATHEWDKCISKIETSDEGPVAWEFKKIEPIMTAEDDGTTGLGELKKGLQVAEGLAFKPFELYPELKIAGWTALAVVVAALIGVIVLLWRYPLPFVPTIVKMAALVVGLLAVERLFLKRVLKYRNSCLQVIGALIMCGVGWVVFYPYMKVIDPLFVKWGSRYRK